MFYIHFLFLALPGEKEPGWGWRRFKDIEITQIERHLISYLCRSIVGCKTTRVLKGNSLVSPPWCGYLVHIFGIFDCSYSFGMWSLVRIWHRRGEEPLLTIFWRPNTWEPSLLCIHCSYIDRQLWRTPWQRRRGEILNFGISTTYLLLAFNLQILRVRHHKYMFNSRLVTANFEKLYTYLMSKNKIYNKCHALTNGPPETSRENFIAARQDASWNVKKKMLSTT